MMMKLHVTGMTCAHCVAAVTQAVKALPGVDGVSVDLKTGQLLVQGSPDQAALRDAVAEEGYEAIF